MPDGTRALLGRDAQMRAFDGALDAAERGLGSAWLLIGEAGIGKSRVMEELAKLADERGIAVAFGRCWEAGGAPAFWPWIQVIRAALRRGGLDLDAVGATRARHLVQLLPELRDVFPDLPDLPPLEPSEARFGLLDAAVALLSEIAERRALAIFLEDLHASDPSSLLLLEMLATHTRGTRLLLVGGYRPEEAPEPVERLLTRIGRVARTLPLPRLTREEVEAYLEATLNGPAPPAAVDKIHRTSEGNPLFVVETTRWLLAHRDLESISPDESVVVPTTLHAVIEHRLGDLSQDAREVLATASVLGRDVDTSELARLTGRGRDELQGALSEASRAALMTRAGPEEHRFLHILFRETLYAGLPKAQRSSLHLHMAEVLEGIEPTPHSRLAHHLIRAGANARGRAIDACIAAAEQAGSSHAYEDSVTWLQRARELAAGVASDRRRCALLLALGRAQIRAGQPAEGRASCLAAAELARPLGEPELVAQAALEYGHVFVFGEVDPRLVSLLETALEQQPRGDGTLRAQLMARLASARQPAPDPDLPIALAKEAIAMARRVGAPGDLLATLRSACSAMMDLGDPVERAALNEEHMRLALELADPVEALRGAGRLIFDRYEIGDVTGANEAIDDAARFAERLEIPHYGWRIAAFRSVESLRRGAFTDHERYVARARRLAEHAGDPNAARCLALQEVMELRLRGRFADALEAIGALRSHLGRSPFGLQVTAALAASVLSSLGRLDEARIRLDQALVDSGYVLKDPSLLEPIAHAITYVGGHEALVARVLDAFAAQPERFISWGMLGLSIGPPVGHALAHLALASGRHDEADQRFDEATRLLRETGARAQLAWTLHEHARVSPCSVRARSSTEEADALFSELSIEAPARAARSGEVEVERDGEHWVVRHLGTTLRLTDSKGVRLLARLVAEPGRSFHVLDLASPTGSAGDLDRGDAGPAIDERAKAAYRARVLELQESLREAEDWNDSARALRAREELEALRSELARAVGLGGRTRREKAASERARVNVQRRLKDTIRRIGQLDAGLGQLFERAVKTGTSCVFEPPTAQRKNTMTS